MKNSKYFVTLILCVILIGSTVYGIISQTNCSLMNFPNAENYYYIQKKDSLSQNLIPSSSELYSEIENLQDYNLKLKRNIATQSKKNIKMIGDIKNVITCYYQSDKLIITENRFYDKYNKTVSFKIFDFTDNNKCIICSIKNVDEDESCYYYCRNKYIVEYKWNLNPTIIEDSKKRNTAIKVKSDLDSTMLHFPEFKYSFDWK